MNNYEKILDMYGFKKGENNITDEFTLFTGLANKKTKDTYFFELRGQTFSLGVIVNNNMSLKEMAEEVSCMFSQAVDQWLDSYSHFEEFEDNFLKLKIFQEIDIKEGDKHENINN